MTFDSFNGVSMVLLFHAQLRREHRIVLELFPEKSNIFILKKKGGNRNKHFRRKYLILITS